MAHINNILASILAFILGLAFTWLAWTPVTTLVTYLPTELALLVNVAFIVLIVSCLIILPVIFAVSSDLE